MFSTLAFAWEVLFGIPQVIFVVGGAIAITGVIAVQWRMIHEARDRRELKRQLVERGFSAEEIERVIRAGTGGDKGD